MHESYIFHLHFYHSFRLYMLELICLYCLADVLHNIWAQNSATDQSESSIVCFCMILIKQGDYSKMYHGNLNSTLNVTII